jgi:hypothetical protein
MTPAALAVALTLAWLNFLTTSRWAAEPGALHGWRKPWYAAALVAATAATIGGARRLGTAPVLGRQAPFAVLAAGAAVLVAAFFSKMPLETWGQIPFKDDWPELFQQAVNGATLLRRGVVVGWNWWFLGGYPTSTDIAQNFAWVSFVPMWLLGDRLGYHVLHLVLFLAVPVFVWFDLRRENPTEAVPAAGFACLFAAGYFGRIASSGDTNSLVGVFCAALALLGSRHASLGRAWGGPVQMLGLTLALSSHSAFFVYAVIYLGIEAAYFRDRGAARRLGLTATFAIIGALPMHWESLRYPGYVSFNNTVYNPAAPIDWPTVARTIYYNVEILALPNRWFNDYRSLINVWWPALLVVALAPGRSRAGFFAWAALATQGLLRINTSEAGAMFDRIQHMFPLLAAAPLAAFVLRFSGTRTAALSLIAVIALYVHTSFSPVRHVPDIRAFDPPLMDRIAASEGMVLVEVSPHRDMDSHPVRRTPTTPFDVHFEGLLPGLAGQRFYSQMIDGWVWNIFRGQVVGAGTFRGSLITETPEEDFVAEMRRWGVAHLFVWTDISRGYLAGSGRFVERWRGGPWSHFELRDADTRSAVTGSGSARLMNLDLLGADVELTNVRAGDQVVVRANYYPAWLARTGNRDVPLYSADGQLAFRAPADGSYVVRLEYPRYRWLSLVGLLAIVLGLPLLWRFGAAAPPKAAAGVTAAGSTNPCDPASPGGSG